MVACCGPFVGARRSLRDRECLPTARLSFLLFFLLTREGRTFVHTSRAGTPSSSWSLLRPSSWSSSSPSASMALRYRPSRRPPCSHRELWTKFPRDAGIAILYCNNGEGDSGESGSWPSPTSSSSSGSSSTRDGHGEASRRRNNGDDGSGGGEKGARLSITTFNVLAPIFKRIGHTGQRESEFKEQYLERNKAVLEHLKGLGSDVICLQELWVAEKEMVDMYQATLKGYRMFTLARTEARGDGVACFVKDGVQVLDRQDLRLKGVGGRVALVLRLGIGGETAVGGQRREVVVANTHLLFPHARTFQILRIRELRKLLAFVECYTQTNGLAHLPVVLCGDLNGKTSGRVYQHLADRGFRCSYEDALGPGADCSRWITHVNHLGEELGVDYVWYRNPDPALGPMEPAWESIVYQSTKQQLLSSYAAVAPTRLAAAAAVAAAAGDGGGSDSSAVEDQGVENDIERSRLFAACQLLGLSEGFELDAEELKLLLDSSADDFDFLVPQILDGSSTGLEGASGGQGTSSSSSEAGGSTLKTMSSRVYPPSLEEGLWPPDYTMSDHGSLTTTFQVAPPSTPTVPDAKTGRRLSGRDGGRERGENSRKMSGNNAAGGQVSARATVSDDRFIADDDGHYGLR